MSKLAPAVLKQTGPVESVEKLYTDSGAAPVRARLVAVGQRWGPRAADLLGELASADPRNAWLASLLEGASR